MVQRPKMQILSLLNFGFEGTKELSFTNDVRSTVVATALFWVRTLQQKQHALESHIAL